MIEKINEKIKLIEKYNSYDARFIVKVLKYYEHSRRIWYFIIFK